MIPTALTLLRKDLRLFVRDRTALFFLLVLPIGLGAVMGTAMGGGMMGGGTKSRKIAIAIEDLDQTPRSQELVEAVRAVSALRVEVMSDVRRVVADGDRAGGLVIPEGYGAASRRATPCRTSCSTATRPGRSRARSWCSSSRRCCSSNRGGARLADDEPRHRPHGPARAAAARSPGAGGVYLRVEDIMEGSRRLPRKRTRGIRWPRWRPPSTSRTRARASRTRARARRRDRHRGSPGAHGAQIEDLSPPRADGFRGAGASMPSPPWP